MGSDDSFVFQTPKGDWAFEGHCGTVVEGFGSKTDAEIALRLHKIGCKNCP